MACISMILLKENKNYFTTNPRIIEYTKLGRDPSGSWNAAEMDVVLKTSPFLR